MADYGNPLDFFQALLYGQMPVWSPDGTEIGFYTEHTDAALCNGNISILDGQAAKAAATSSSQWIVWNDSGKPVTIGAYCASKGIVGPGAVTGAIAQGGTKPQTLVVPNMSGSTDTLTLQPDGSYATNTGLTILGKNIPTIYLIGGGVVGIIILLIVLKGK